MVASIRSSTNDSNSSTTSLTTSAPAGIISGDIRIHVLSKDSSDTITGPTSATLRTAISGSMGTTHQLEVFSQIAGGSEGNDSVSWSGNEGGILYDLAIQNHDNFDAGIEDKDITSGNRTTATVPSITTSVDNCLLLAFIASEDAASVIDVASGWTEPVSQLNIGSGVAGARISIQIRTQVTAGATGTMPFTQANSQELGASVTAIKPSGAAAPFIGQVISF